MVKDLRQSRSRWIELSWVYLVTLLVTGIGSAVQGQVAWLDGYLLVIAAATFLYLPLEVIARRGDDQAEYGIHRRGIVRATLIALGLCVIIFPPYTLGFHYWQTDVVGQHLASDEARFDRWPMAVRGVPARRNPAPGEVHVFHENQRFWLNWKLSTESKFEVVAISDKPLTALKGGWEINTRGASLTSVAPRGRATLATESSAVKFEIKMDNTKVDLDRIRVGAAFTSADSNPVSFHRGYWWLFELVLIQLLLIALPEEVFFRGYLQSTIDKLVGSDRKVFGVDFNVKSTFLVSALFAIGHFITIPNPARLAVFFPSIVFG